MLGTILIVVLVMALLGVLPQVVSQPGLGLRADGRSGTDAGGRRGTPASRPHLVALSR